MIIRWGKWYSFKYLEEKDFKCVPPKSGVYQIRCAINGKPIPINRVKDTDKEGILYIGGTKSLRGRIRAFWRGIHKKSGSFNHTAARTYVTYNYSEKFPMCCLEVRWAEIDDPRDALSVEKKLLDEYIEKYLDKPPLNLSIRRG